VCFAAYQELGFAHLLLGGMPEIAAEVEGYLHPYLRQRYAGRIDARLDSRLEDILAATLEVEDDLERRREAAHVERLRSTVNGNGKSKGASGLDPVLEALHQHRVDQLLVSSGYEEPGWRCGACNRLASVGRACPACGADMIEIEDIVEEAVEEALRQSCAVDVCVGSADLDVLGRIGALLRY
jgi:peptide subunit release factor 1 (eRF1)